MHMTAGGGGRDEVCCFLFAVNGVDAHADPCGAVIHDTERNGRNTSCRCPALLLR